MPVNVQFVSNNYDFLKKVGVSTHVIEQLKFDGGKVKMGVNTVSFATTDGNLLLGQVVLPVKIDTALKGVAGGIDIGPILEAHIEKHILPKLKGLKTGEMTEEEVVAEVEQEVTTHSPQVSFKQHFTLKPEEGAKIKFLPDEGSGSSPFSLGSLLKKAITPGEAGLPVSTLKAADPVALRDATHMYQRVMGTSSPDYYVIAMNEKVRVAVKLQKNSVSMRAEGELTPVVRSALEKAKLMLKQQGGQSYMSNHFMCSDQATPSHVIGALLSAMEMDFDTPFPSMKKLKGLAGVA